MHFQNKSLNSNLTYCNVITDALNMCYYKITKIVRTLWLAERRGCMRVCNHGCDVTLSVSPAHFKAVSLILKYKYKVFKWRTIFQVLIWSLTISFPLSQGKKAKEKNNSACVSNLDDLV